MFWYGLLAFGVAALFALLGFFHWLFTAQDLEQSPAGDRFHAEQDYRAQRRAGKLTPR